MVLRVRPLDEAKRPDQYVVTDPDHPRFEGVFTYALLDDKVACVGIEVRVKRDTTRKAARNMNWTDAYNLPVGRWERAARAAMGDDHPVASLGLPTVESAEAIYPPTLSVARSKKAMKASRRLERVAKMYRQAVLAGESNPAAVVAEREGGIAEATARVLIHRARKEGFLPPTGREKPKRKAKR
jgi:hypothetical protein